MYNLWPVFESKWPAIWLTADYKLGIILKLPARVNRKDGKTPFANAFAFAFAFAFAV